MVIRLSTVAPEVLNANDMNNLNNRPIRRNARFRTAWLVHGRSWFETRAPGVPLSIPWFRCWGYGKTGFRLECRKWLRVWPIVSRDHRWEYTTNGDKPAPTLLGYRMMDRSQILFSFLLSPMLQLTRIVYIYMYVYRYNLTRVILVPPIPSFVRRGDIGTQPNPWYPMPPTHFNASLTYILDFLLS